MKTLYKFISEFNPMPTDDVVVHFNELRQDIVLLYELKLALANCDYELETLRHRLETVAPGKVCTIFFQFQFYSFSFNMIIKIQICNIQSLI